MAKDPSELKHWSEYPKNLYPPQRVKDLRDDGHEVENPIDESEAIRRGWKETDTEKTRLVKFKDEIIEIDWRKRVSAKGDRIVWCHGCSPDFGAAASARAAKQGTRVAIKDGVYVEPNKAPAKKRRPSIKTVLKGFLESEITYKEYNKLPGSARAAMEELFEGRVTRADVAGFALMAKAMQGDINAFKEIADRVEGKSINRNENKNLNLTYEDFLSKKAAEQSGEDEEE